MSKYCPDCGTELPDDLKFCVNCGRKLSAEPARVGPAAANGAAARVQPRPAGTTSAPAAGPDYRAESGMKDIFERFGIRRMLPFVILMMAAAIIAVPALFPDAPVLSSLIQAILYALTAFWLLIYRPAKYSAGLRKRLLEQGFDEKNITGIVEVNRVSRSPAGRRQGQHKGLARAGTFIFALGCLMTAFGVLATGVVLMLNFILVASKLNSFNYALLIKELHITALGLIGMYIGELLGALANLRKRC